MFSKHQNPETYRLIHIARSVRQMKSREFSVFNLLQLTSTSRHWIFENKLESNQHQLPLSPRTTLPVMPEIVRDRQT